ncbi:DUF559 domain-containing protein [Verrucosispora sp. SN26_14.1]|nr:DUF559 domain-containing protein [Verrucosispora sp. SN26_14.1]
MIRYSELLATGWSRGQVRGQIAQGALLRLTRGVYGPPAAADDHLRAIFERLPDGAVAGFHTGAMLHGFGDARSTRCHVIVPAGSVVPQIRGVVAHESVVPVRDPVRIRGLPCAPAARCAVDLARSLRRTEALPVLDLCLRATACRRDDLHDELGRHRGLRNVRQARDLIGLADPRSECRQESQLRLILVDAGLPAPEPQLWVHDRYGIPLHRIDLAYRKRRIGIEYDGQSHLTPELLHYDRSRSNWLAGQGWRMRYFTADDLYRRPTHIVTTIHHLLAP